MKPLITLRAVYNDKEVLKKLRKSIGEYALNLRSMEQLKRDSKEIETYIKETYDISSTTFKKIVKASTVENDNVEDIIDEMQIIRDIARAE
jgi:hypothetical protein